ncbi:FAD-dependent oxidoreductase [Cetobacterium sp. 8H]|uniref:dihydrolipoyl dehydrogenase family protein n=1 Tax=Cetobacterium sp. 8H TaxID=2759681 RepID=UPI00163C2EC4|nr:FAD-dependent oxidoreductase [Cetobacterium sp. 8H]MBC2850035.1 FAD-dependent oxidoreductase [Cetobacterium sp. 8H]
MNYDCIVVGSGAAGLTVSFGLKATGKKVLLIEKDQPGGECTWNGCIPSKSFISYSKKEIDLKTALEKVREKILEVAKTEDSETISQKGIDFIKGKATFVSKTEVEVAGKIYQAKNIVIATGSRAFIPKIKGLEKVEFLTNENFFKQTSNFKSIIMIGGGVISLELSFALKRLGVEVTILELGKKFLSIEDPEIGEFYKKRLIQEGIELVLDCGEITIEKINNMVVTKCSRGEYQADKLFLSVGRAPNLEELNLDKIGISFDKKGILTNECLQTTIKEIYAVGDIVGPYRFSHIAGYHGETVVRNIVFPYIKKKIEYKNISWTMFSSPEFARVGINEEEAKNKGLEINIYTLSEKENDRSIVSLEEKFYLKVICDKKFNILGASCIGERAGEIINLLQILKSQNIKFYKMVNSIQAYPTYGDSVRKLAKKAYGDYLKKIFSFKL